MNNQDHDTPPESDGRKAVLTRIEEWRRRPHRLAGDFITSAHGAGGKASQSLLQAVILPGFGSAELKKANDGAILDVGDESRVVLTTDSFVVTPRRFNGGSIGDLAVNGTVNDLAVMGATPRWMSVAFVVEEGFHIDDFRDVVADIARAAMIAGIEIVTGDTKVVGKGAADGIYVTTTGVGVLPDGRDLAYANVRPGDKVIVSGSIGDHGIAVLIARGDIELQAEIPSDTAPVHIATEILLNSGASVRWMRDPTRGGVASTMNELAMCAEVGVRLYEQSLPVLPAVNGTCELLGLDPLYVANEGKFIAVVAPEHEDIALAALKSVEVSRGARVIGEITDQHPGLVVLETLFGGTRIVDMLVGDPLPRIC